jgi:RNA polymerase sigma factor (sigma-70 family)
MMITVSALQRSLHENNFGMPETQDAIRLAEMLKALRDFALQLDSATDLDERDRLRVAIAGLRDACFQVVDRYFRGTLGPILARRFPGKVSPPEKPGKRVPSPMFQYSQLVGDFFVQVLSNYDDPFWKKDSAIELRNYASTVISRDVIDALRRRKKREPLADEQVRKSFEEMFAAEVEQQFVTDGVEIDPADALEVVEQWQQSGDERRRKLAMLLRHKYVSGMTMQQIADDLKVPVKTAYRWHTTALKELRAAF